MRFLAALPKTVKAIAVLDRTKEPGSAGEPLYLDVVQAIYEAATTNGNEVCEDAGRGRRALRLVVEGIHARHGQGRCSTIWRIAKPKNHFTIGIHDDVLDTQPAVDDPAFSTEPKDVVRAVFFGLGADGTVGANKDSIKIIGEYTPNFAQGYFVYDSKKSGAATISHLRFGPRNIRSTYLISHANFVACHQPSLLDRYDMLKYAQPGATFLLNTALRAGGSVQQAAGNDAAADHREEIEVFCDQRLQGRQGKRHGRAHQHDHAGLFLRALRRVAARRSHRAHQVFDQENLRQEGRGNRPDEHQGRGRDAGVPARSQSAGGRSCRAFRCGPRCRCNRPRS